jgi:nucleoside-diphosphate-sugar epimerase
VALEGCGLTAAEQAELARHTTHIIHGAATIRFDHPIGEARAINTGGTRNMVALARRCAGEGRLRRFVWIGTSSVSGRRGGRILEEELETGQEFFNSYEQSKCEAERILRDAMGELPITICRPSIIIGDSHTGRTSSFNVIYIPLRLLFLGLLTAVPGKPETTLDLVPVDWVNDVITHLTAHPDAAGAVCHVTAGRERAALLGDLVGAAAAYFDLHAPLPVPREVEFISGEEFERRKATVGGRQGALLAQLDTLLPYVSIDRLFDSTTTDRLLRGSGISFPPFNTYAHRILAYCLDSDWGRRDVPVMQEHVHRTAM